jgi:hypothetical protein
MNRRSRVISIGAAAIILATAWFLGGWAKRQRLGEPGLRVVASPVYGIEVSREATNTFLVGSNSIYLPEQVMDYQSYPNPITKQVWDWLPKDTTYGQRVYRDTNGFQIYATAVLMRTDRTTIHQPQYCLTGQGWGTVSEEQTTIGMEKPVRYDLPITKMKLRKAYRAQDGQEHEVAAVLVYWFVADNQLTADHRQRMWWMARDLLRSGVLQRWAYVLQFSICQPGEEEATFARLTEFIRASVPEYQLVPERPKTMASAPAEQRMVTD